jgi:uracil-DNA glycosylase family 4
MLNMDCKKCTLCTSRTQVVPGCGKINGLMLIGEAPGFYEDRMAIPFVGEAGGKLNKILASVGLHRDDIFITNVVKCRPPGNRTPTRIEADTCYEYLIDEIMQVEPRVILCAGGVSSSMLIHRDFRIMRERGQWHIFKPFPDRDLAIPIIATFHPSFIVRQEKNDPVGVRKYKWQVYEDMQSVVSALTELPDEIADKVCYNYGSDTVTRT